MFDKLSEPKRFWISADLGLEHDYTFITVLDNYEEYEDKYAYEHHRYLRMYKTHYRVQDMRRLALPTSEDAIIKAVTGYVMDAHKRAAQINPRPEIWVTLDRTGIGLSITRNVRDAIIRAETLAGISPFDAANTRGVFITNGAQMNRKGWLYNVPRLEMLHALKAGIGSGRFKAPRKLKLAAVIEEELRAFNPDKKLRKDDETEEAIWRRPGTHDDGVFSASMPVVIAETLKLSDHWRKLGNPMDGQPFEEPPVAPAGRTPITGAPLLPLP
jgi:hypothetical protein